MNTKNEHSELSALTEVEKILLEGDVPTVRALFAFSSNTSDDDVLEKFEIWSRWFFPQYFKVDDAPFHRDIDRSNLAAYRGSCAAFVDIAFRGGAKTTRTKLFFAFAIANDKEEHYRRYLKILTKDIANAKQSVTDIYNMLINQIVRPFYPELFVKLGDEKREETMSSFTTATGVKVRAGTVGMDQRGQLQEDSRPDLIWFDDFETRNTLRSAVETQKIWDNMQEAWSGRSMGGAAIYTCNYLSERGNVHKLVQPAAGRVVLIVPIIKDGKPTWPAAYTVSSIEVIRQNADDFAGEYLCEPSAGADIFFDRATLDRQVQKQPRRTVADFKIFHEFDPSHRYGMGADTAGGVGLDSSTSVLIDYSTVPNRVAATFKSDTIKPDAFGYELIRQGEFFSYPMLAVENNKFDMCIGVLKARDYPNLYFEEVETTRAGLPPRTKYYGWNTNSMTKPKMLFELMKAVTDGHLELSDPDLIAEARSYTRDDLMDKDEDVRLTTRHFDLLMACAIAWQMRNFATVAKPNVRGYQQSPFERSGFGD